VAVQFHRFIPIGCPPGSAFGRRGWPFTVARSRQRTPRVHLRPPGRGDQLIQDHPFSFPGCFPIFASKLLCDFPACIHRQCSPHPPSTPQRPQRWPALSRLFMTRGTHPISRALLRVSLVAFSATLKKQIFGYRYRHPPCDERLEIPRSNVPRVGK